MLGGFIMKYTYKFNYDDYYLIGENEWFYEEMAKKGWILKKRGIFLSKFIRSEPCEMSYRVELAGKSGKLPKAQIALYEDCGWEMVTRMGDMYIFGALKDSGAPEFYGSTMERTVPYKHLISSTWKSILINIVNMLIFFVLPFINVFRRGGGIGAILGNMGAYYTVDLVKSTALTLALFLGYGFILIVMPIRLYKAVKLFRSFKNGEEIKRPKKKNLGKNIVMNGVPLLAVVFFLLSIVQFFNKSKYELSDGNHYPIISLAELNIEGESTPVAEGEYSFIDDRIVERRALLSTFWELTESKMTDDGEVSLHQTVYYVKNKNLVKPFVEALKNDYSYCEEIQVQGVDKAFALNEEKFCIVKGQYVYWFKFWRGGDFIDIVEVLEKTEVFTDNGEYVEDLL